VDALPLDPGTYTGTYKLIGGQLSLDLVNTVSWPGTEREHDWFDNAENVTRWALAVGLIDARRGHRLNRKVSGSRDVASDLDAVRGIRQRLRAAISPLAHGRRPATGSIKTLNGLLARACRRRQLDASTLRWTWSEPTTLIELMDPVIWNAGEVLSAIDPSRIGHCLACDWLFHDTTRNRSRRWCDMADCGSRDKALRYYHRHKDDPSRRSSSD
jgi:predicted RNA-binding Zn ribbon-like protein